MYNPTSNNYDASTNNGLSWPLFAVGALVGAGICMVVTPKAGREIRNLLADKGRELLHKVDEGIRKAEQLGREYREQYAETDTL